MVVGGPPVCLYDAHGGRPSSKIGTETLYGVPNYPCESQRHTRSQNEAHGDPPPRVSLCSTLKDTVGVSKLLAMILLLLLYLAVVSGRTT
jgi:hypothetical protein